MVTNTWNEFGIEFTEEFEEYDENLSSNGGSYFQPCYWAKLNNKEFVISDTSCGEFGTRIYVALYEDKKRIKYAQYGTMESMEYTEFNTHDKGWLLVGRYLGYNIPYIAG